MIQVSDNRFISRDVIAEVLFKYNSSDKSYDYFTLVTKRGEKVDVLPSLRRYAAEYLGVSV